MGLLERGLVASHTPDAIAGLDYFVLLELADKALGDGHVIASLDEIARDTRLSLQDVVLSVRRLVGWGQLERGQWDDCHLRLTVVKPFEAERRAATGRNIRRHLDVLILRQDGACGICGGRLPALREGIHVDHVVPMQRGGTDEIQNLQAAHASCNLWKGTRLMSELPEPPDWLPG